MAWYDYILKAFGILFIGLVVTWVVEELTWKIEEWKVERRHKGGR